MHDNETEAQLAAKLRHANKLVTVGARYMHYKQQSYRVLALALREADNEPCVIYQAEYGDKLVWIRPVASWIEDVDMGGKATKRFTKL